ncbi:MAG: lipocalin-like domain-containing protein [Acetobacteraceae bacterium]
MSKDQLSELIGSWKLVSIVFTMSDNGETICQPLSGFCTFDADGRWTVVAVPSDLPAPTTDAERVTLFNRTIAFSGRCSVSGNRLTVKVDVAWNPAFHGSELVRFVDLEGDRLIVTQPEWEHPFFNGRKTVVTVEWVRE